MQQCFLPSVSWVGSCCFAARGFGFYQWSHTINATVFLAICELSRILLFRSVTYYSTVRSRKGRTNIHTCSYVVCMQYHKIVWEWEVFFICAIGHTPWDNELKPDESISPSHGIRTPTTSRFHMRSPGLHRYGFGANTIYFIKLKWLFSDGSWIATFEPIPLHK